MGTLTAWGRLAAIATVTVAALTGCSAEPAEPGEVETVHEAVAFYPACGNEVLDHEGVLWYPFEPEGDAFSLPVAAALARVADLPGAAPVPHVAAPGPGDDTGTLIVYDNGVAYFESESGNIDAWLTREEQTYNWVC